MSQAPDRTSRLTGGLLGLLVGDALGVPYEFHDAASIPPLHQIEPEPPSGFPRAHRATPPGTWSDDGAQALCLLASLVEHGELVVSDFGARLLAWHDQGYCAVDARVFDVGIQTSRALARLRAGEPAESAGPSGERDNGNGSLMRVLPLALWHRGSDADLARDAMLQSRVTHGHPRSMVACAFYCLWARRLLEDSAAPFDEAAEALRATLEPAHHAELALFEERADPPRGSGYVLDSFRATRHLLEDASAPYESVFREAIALGDDTDTTAAIAGGLAGIRGGVEQIPERWMKTLRGRDIVEPLVEALTRRG